MLSNNTKVRFKRIETFLMKSDFNGFTKNDLFIMGFIKNGWGQDIAALSNMAEAIVNLSILDKSRLYYYKILIKKVLDRAIHKNVNPYKMKINEIDDLGKYGYYLEHLNIVLGCYETICKDSINRELNCKISNHLIQNSLMYENFHADLLPHVNMKWSADQAAILYSLWLYDKNFKTNISSEIISKWISFMKKSMIHYKTGLFKTEVLGTRKYSNEPRGCSLSYMIHYMGRFNKKEANAQWKLFKKYMMKSFLGRYAFREYLPSYNGKWTPDTGPIIAGCGVASTGLALNASSTIGDKKVFKGLERTMTPFGSLFNKTDSMPGLNKLTKIGTDLLSTSIWLNAETKQEWF